MKRMVSRLAITATLALGAGATTAASAAAAPSPVGPTCHAFYVSLGAHIFGGFENAVDVVSADTATVRQGQDFVRTFFCG